MPLYRDGRGKYPNLTSGLLDVLGEQLERPVTAEGLVAYVYGLTATGAFTERFADELGEGAGPVRIPITSDAYLFAEVAALGKELLWWHTWGERFGDGRELPIGVAAERRPVMSYPETFRWDAASEVLQLGGGEIGPVSAAVWNFDISGLKVLQSWLGNRMKKGKGKKSSPLDDIRPERWTFTPELLTLLSILEHTVTQTPRAAELLNRVMRSDLIDAAHLPTPSDAERKAPRD